MRDPVEARSVIEQGKLAVVLGVEVSQPFGCGIRNGVAQCDQADIDAGLDELYDLGVRRMFVCHKFDNALCGVRFDGGTAGTIDQRGELLLHRPVLAGRDVHRTGARQHDPVRGRPADRAADRRCCHPA